MTTQQNGHNDFIQLVEAELYKLLEEDRALQAQEQGVRRKRAELGEEIQRLRGAASTYRELMGVAEEAKPSVGLFDDLPVDGTIADMAEVLFRGRGAMKVAEIVGILEEVGKLKRPDIGESVRGNYGTVYGTLTRDKHRFVKKEQGVFDLVGSPAEDGASTVRHPDMTVSYKLPEGGWRNADGSITSQPRPVNDD